MNFEKWVLDNEWPGYDPKFLVEDEIEIGVQIKGKFRGSIKIAKDADQDTAMQKVRAVESINKYIEGQNIRKIIYIKCKILNIII